MEQPSADAPGKDLLKVHAPLFTPSARARADHKIVVASSDGPNQSVHQFGAVAAVTVEEDYDVASRVERPHARSAGAAITALRFRNDTRSGQTRALSRAVIATVVNDDHFSGDLRRDGAHYVSDGRLLVERGDDNRNARFRQDRSEERRVGKEWRSSA